MRYIIWIILAVALSLRLWGVTHGYPHSYYPDEAHFVKRALSFGSGDLNPHWFHKPAFFMYMLFFEYGIFFVIGKIVNLWSSVTEFAVFYINNPGPFYIIGRVLVVFFSFASVALTYLIGRHQFNPVTAWTSSLIMAVSYGAVITSKDIKADSACAFFTLLSYFFLLRYFQQGTKSQRKWLVLTSCLAGVGTATKVYSVIMLAPIAFVVLTQKHDSWRKRFANLLLQGTVFWGTYFILSPFNFLDPQGRHATFGPLYTVYEKIAYMLGRGQAELRIGVSREIQNIDHSAWDLVLGIGNYVLKLAEGMNPLVLTLAVLGLVMLLRNKFSQGVVICLFPMMFAAISVFMNPGYANMRHQLPVYPFIALLAGLVFSKCRLNRPIATMLIISLSLFLIYDTRRIVTANVILAREDIRNEAQVWIETNLPAGSKILLDEEGPVLRKSETQLQQEIEQALQATPGPFTTHYSTYLNYLIE